jgi:phosphatidylserine/phosphatidylglycerophosphate/cardiolipin synthase-like enzyme
MRSPIVGNAIKARAIAGTYTVLLALDATEEARKGLLGFAIRRQDPTENEDYWLKASKVFKSVVPNPPPEDIYSTLEHPIQSFLWGDYTAKPDRDYVYTFRPMYGKPKKLEPGPDVTLKVHTEPERTGAHGVWFNRGAIASRAYALKYENSAPPKPHDPTHEQTKWLSRGLLEACLQFIDETTQGQALRVAAYEFTYPPALEALKRAIARGVDVHVVYEAGKESGKPGAADTATAKANKSAIKKHKFPKSALTPRKRRRKIPHNKFIVRLNAQGKPVAVWSGSTNFTESGFLGQSNAGHRIDDPTVAGQFLGYWKLLSGDPAHDAAVAECMRLTPTPQGSLAAQSMATLFSPRSDKHMLTWYADRIASAKNTVMFTAAFAVEPTLATALAENRGFLRFVLAEKPPTKKTDAVFKKDRDLVIAYGNVLGTKYVENAKGERTLRREIPDFRLDEWFVREEHYRKRGHVFFVHLKILLVDPLTNAPLVCSGSANFSVASLRDNDENMLLINGDTRVADIYLTEFDRLLRHFYFRNMAAELHDDGQNAKAKFLDETPEWVKEHFESWRMKSKRRELFFPKSAGVVPSQPPPRPATAARAGALASR